MRRLGQHFLKDIKLARKIVGALDIQPGETVIEVGPGHGELTAPLLEAACKAHAAVIAIERDHELLPALAELGDHSAGTLMVVEGDALKMLPDVAAKIMGNHRGGSYIVAGNIPYYITGKLLRILGELPQKPRASVLMVQKEVAERICATAPDMNRLAASIQFWAEPAILARVPKEDFSPPPDVDSAVIKLKTRTGAPLADPALYYRAVRGIFAQPRKTILNNALAMAGGQVGKGEISEKLVRAGIDPAARPQDIAIGDLIALTTLELWG